MEEKGERGAHAKELFLFSSPLSQLLQLLQAVFPAVGWFGRQEGIQRMGWVERIEFAGRLRRIHKKNQRI
jgi:hypothetical protein